MTPSLDAANELRIIAKDGACLQHPYRDDLMRIADELEMAQRTVATLYAQLIEAKQQLAATQERLRTVYPTQAYVFPFSSMGGRPKMTARFGQ